MKVLNSSVLQKNLKIGKVIISFPPGISEQPEDVKILNYVSKHSDLSVHVEEQKKINKKDKKKGKNKKKNKSAKNKVEELKQED